MLEAFSRLVQAGKVRYIGASNFRAWRLEQSRCTSRSHGWPEYCSVQQRYSYLQPRAGTTFDPQLAANDDLLDYCRSRQLTLLAYSPLLGGAYARPELDPGGQYQGPDNQMRMSALCRLPRKPVQRSTRLCWPGCCIATRWCCPSSPPALLNKCAKTWLRWTFR